MIKHTNEEDYKYKCDTCGKRYALEQSFRYHITTAHRKDNSTNFPHLASSAKATPVMDTLEIDSDKEKESKSKKVMNITEFDDDFLFSEQTRNSFFGKPDGMGIFSNGEIGAKHNELPTMAAVEPDIHTMEATLTLPLRAKRPRVGAKSVYSCKDSVLKNLLNSND